MFKNGQMPNDKYFYFDIKNLKKNFFQDDKKKRIVVLVKFIESSKRKEE